VVEGDRDPPNQLEPVNPEPAGPRPDFRRVVTRLSVGRRQAVDVVQRSRIRFPARAWRSGLVEGRLSPPSRSPAGERGDPDPISG
jgi:hypothetical protein